MTRSLAGSEMDTAGNEDGDRMEPMKFGCMIMFQHTMSKMKMNSYHRQDDRDHGSHTVCAEVTFVCSDRSSLLYDVLKLFG